MLESQTPPPPRFMPVLHLTNDAHGISHFADLDVPLNTGAFAPPASPMPVSATEAATGLLYLVSPAGWGGAQHPSPRRPSGLLPLGRPAGRGTGDGQTREFGAGAIWQMEDVAGAGHTTTFLGDEDVNLAIVQLSPHPGDRKFEENL